MMKSFLIIWSLLLAGMVYAQPEQEKARFFLEQVFKGKYAESRQYFDSTLLDAVKESDLEELHLQIQGFYGELEQVDSIVSPEPNVVYLFARHSSARIRWAITFNKAGEQAGFFLKPLSSKSSYQPPRYVIPGTIYETNATIPMPDGLGLEAVITLPRVKQGKLPGIVLVHGSGPQDKDESLNNLKPFQDLAWGLAAQGFVVIRYEKRTKMHAEVCARDTAFDMDKETVDDAVAALELLAQRSDVDPKNLYVLGHSQGGLMAPRILQRYPKAKGAILMAAPARSFKEVVFDQFDFMRDSLGMPEEMAAEGKRKYENTVSPEFSMQWDTDSFPFANAHYWNNIRYYDPVKVALKTKKPFLVLQGGRDFQVFNTDFETWKQLGKKGTYYYYPDLNHPMIPGSGPKNLEEYQTMTGNVPETVILDISRWIRNQR